MSHNDIVLLLNDAGEADHYMEVAQEAMYYLNKYEDNILAPEVSTKLMRQFILDMLIEGRGAIEELSNRIDAIDQKEG